MKSFGLNDRVPGTKEANYIQKWLNTYGFSQDMIILACDKTISATHNPSFEYADRILSSWKKAGVCTPKDVEKYDLEHQIKVNKKKAEAADRRPPNHPTSFTTSSSEAPIMISWWPIITVIVNHRKEPCHASEKFSI